MLSTAYLCHIKGQLGGIVIISKIFPVNSTLSTQKDKPESSDVKKKLERMDSLDNARSLISSMTASIAPAADLIIPGSGTILGVTGNIISQSIGGYVGKTQAEILLQIINDLDKLKTLVEEFKIENLVDNATFVTTLLRVLPLALRNTQKEKMDAYRSTILNTALGNTPDEDSRLMFLNNLDTLTSSHLKILTYFKDPQGWFQLRGRNIPDIGGSAFAGLKIAHPEFEGKEDFCNIIVEDLIARGLMQKGSYMTGGLMSSTGVYSPRITDLGREFISFITSPIDL